MCVFLCGKITPMKKYRLLMAIVGAMLLSSCVVWNDMRMMDDVVSGNSGRNSRPAINVRDVQIPKIEVVKGTPEGVFIDYHTNGQLKIESYVENGELNRYVKTYYDNGQLQSETILVNGLSEGLSYGYTRDGKLNTEIPYHKGRANGIVKRFNPDGSILGIMEYKNGQLVRTQSGLEYEGSLKK